MLTKPVLEGTTLTFDVEVLEGALSGAGPAAIFIDDRGGGGGGGGRGGWSTDDGSGGIFGDGGGIVIGGGQGKYYHAPDLQGAWYSGQGDNGGDLDATDDVANPYCGEYPKPPCNQDQGFGIEGSVFGNIKICLYLIEINGKVAFVGGLGPSLPDGRVQSLS